MIARNDNSSSKSVWMTEPKLNKPHTVIERDRETQRKGTIMQFSAHCNIIPLYRIAISFRLLFFVVVAAAAATATDVERSLIFFSSRTTPILFVAFEQAFAVNWLASASSTRALARAALRHAHIVTQIKKENPFRVTSISYSVSFSLFVRATFSTQTDVECFNEKWKRSQHQNGFVFRFQIEMQSSIHHFVACYPNALK